DLRTPDETSGSGVSSGSIRSLRRGGALQGRSPGTATGPGIRQLRFPTFLKEQCVDGEVISAAPLASETRELARLSRTVADSQSVGGRRRGLAMLAVGDAQRHVFVLPNRRVAASILRSMGADADAIPCAYCGSHATSEDHIPPKNLFPKNARTDLIKVPA